MNIKKTISALTAVTLLNSFLFCNVKAANDSNANYGNMPVVDTTLMNRIENPEISWQNNGQATDSNTHGWGTVKNVWTNDFVMSYDIKLNRAYNYYRYGIFFGTQSGTFDWNSVSTPKDSNGNSKFIGRIGMCGPNWQVETGESDSDGNPVRKAAQWLTGYYENESYATNETYQAYGKNLSNIPLGDEISQGKTYNIYASYHDKIATFGIKLINDGTKDIADSDYYWTQIPYSGSIDRKGGITIYQHEFYGIISNLNVWADESVAVLDKSECKVFKGTELTLSFTESILINPRSVLLTDGENEKRARVEKTDDDKVFKLILDEELSPNTEYSISLNEFLTVSGESVSNILSITTDKGKMPETDTQNMYKVENPNLKFYKQNGEYVAEPQFEGVYGVFENMYAKDFVLKYKFNAINVRDTKLYHLYFGADRDLLRAGDNSLLSINTKQIDKYIAKVGYMNSFWKEVSWIGQYFSNETYPTHETYSVYGYPRQKFDNAGYIKAGTSYDVYLSYVNKQMTFGIKKSDEDESGWVWYSAGYTGTIDRSGTIMISQLGILGTYENVEVYTGENSYATEITLDKSEIIPGETVTATAKALNYGENAQTPALVNALYKKDGNVWKLANVAIDEKNGDVSAKMQIPDDGGEYTVKAFLLKSLSSLVPFGLSKTIE